MSIVDIVSVPRETAKQAANLLAAHSTGPSLERDTTEELLDALEKPAEQHQGTAKRWKLGAYNGQVCAKSECGEFYEDELKGPQTYVLASDYEALLAKLAERGALVAQLQADLTERDEKLDQTQDLLRCMVYDYRSVVQAGYDRITALGGGCDSVAKMLDDNPNYQKALAMLMPDLESRPEERGTPETEPCSGCGTPGWTGACNKCVPY